MRILFLTPHVPYPPHKGTAIRNFNIIENLAARHELTLVSFGEPADKAALAVLRRYCVRVEVIPPPTRSSLRRAFSVIFSEQPDLTLRLSSLALVQRLSSLLAAEEFDVIQIEGLEMAPLWEMAWKGKTTNRRPLVVLDAHNAEYVLQRRAFETDLSRPATWVGAFYSFIQWWKLRRYEAKICRLVDGVVAVSEVDRRMLQSLVPNLKATVVSNGVDLAEFAPLNSEREPFLVFSGTMDFRPNVDAVTWFCREILPRLRAEVPDLRFYIVGRDPKREVLRLGQIPGVIVSGPVADIRPYVGRAAACVVPMRIGGGVRLKVLEAMALGTPVVSTSLGCEGIEVTPDENVLIANDAAEFAEKVLALLRDPERGRGLGRKARQLVEIKYDWRVLVPRLERFYCSLLEIS
ncbi:MAG: glycosyltransferase [Chloroflexi bacterium]|nr:glycosyltransferase [Chloroflexota bacterium]MCL5075340.1 glycosyltransferase [Chloroflexota bacterium]